MGNETYFHRGGWSEEGLYVPTPPLNLRVLEVKKNVCTGNKTFPPTTERSKAETKIKLDNGKFSV